MKATLFDLQRFSVHDGPGIRTTVFMKGCPLRCAWCHNPEGLRKDLQVQFAKAECIGCGLCLEKTMENASRCPTGALKICGSIIDEDSLFEQLLQDRIFYQKDGGITFSGGECLLQADFVANMLMRLKKQGIHTAVDTCGHLPLENIKKTKDHCDLYLYDIKLMNQELHKKWTGAGNELILENLRTISTWNIPIWIRIPIIPDVNDTIDEMESMATFLSSLSHINQVTLMPYHTLGKSKYETLGLPCFYETNQVISNEKLHTFQSIFSAKQLFVTGG